MQTILLIEDESTIADMVLYALRSEGFDAQWKRFGRTAVAWLQENPQTALVVLDIGLPDGNGFEFCKEIRRFSEVPIIFLTARNDEVDRIVGLEIGADDYMGKPFSPRELTARIKVILKRSRVSPESAVAMPSTFEIDQHRYRIRYYDSWLDLTRYEFQILKTLLQQPGRVFSREQIMDQAWQQPEESLERVVDTHIKKLRVKLRQVRADEDPIQTHRGLGYSIRES